MLESGCEGWVLRQGGSSWYRPAWGRGCARPPAFGVWTGANLATGLAGRRSTVAVTRCASMNRRARQRQYRSTHGDAD